MKAIEMWNGRLSGEAVYETAVNEPRREIRSCGIRPCSSPVVSQILLS